MKNLFCLILLFSITINLFGQTNKQGKVKLLNFRTNKIVNIYDSDTKEKVIAKIKDDTISENYYWFYVISKRDSMIKIVASSTQNTKKEIKGWMKITDAGIYTRPKANVYYIYKKPNYDSDKIKLEEDEFVKVLDIYGSWLKVEIKYKNRIYRYWLPYEYQCDDVYNSCT